MKKIKKKQKKTHIYVFRSEVKFLFHFIEIKKKL